jgi:hypothetical protein
LIDADGLRGRVHLRERSPAVDELGPTLEAVTVALGSGGAITGLMAALVSWIRHRTVDIDLKITRDDGTSFELSAKRLRGLDAERIAAEIERMNRLLASRSGPGDG